MADLPKMVKVTTEGGSFAINPDTVARVAPSKVGGSVLTFTDGSFLAVQEDFEDLTGIELEEEEHEAPPPLTP
jgi:hypothetical protein